MKTLTVALPGRAYDIRIERGLLEKAGEAVREACPKAKRLFVVTDSNVLPLYLGRVADSLKKAGFQVICHSFAAGEKAKCAENLVALWEKMMAAGLTRTDGVVALGGGVVGDLAGFAAATILRGVDYIQIPTTLLAQVDSSVGGKVAIDLQAGKNLAGAFWQPKLVLMDPDTLDTLTDATFSGGMAEVIKYGCIWDKNFFDFLAARPSRAQIMADIEHVLYTCCDVKRQVVEEDERDTGKRMLLNFGHTVGHAFELAGHYTEWSHGEAVAAGMCVAARLGVALGVTDTAVPQDILNVAASLGLPTHIDCGWETMVQAVGLDKKRTGDDITMILLERIGKAKPVKMKKDVLLEHLNAIYGR
ncbi:MAG: 3-dehydroquinate synthase [Oscillospiraceae bacterium]|nr:3-dehydroquinate synthase [Oscillospiraceae bacterium]